MGIEKYNIILYNLGMKEKRPGRKKVPTTKKRRNFGFVVTPEVEKFLRGLEDRNVWLENKVHKEKETQK